MGTVSTFHIQLPSVCLNRLANVNTVAVGVFKHVGPQSVVLVLKALEDSQPILPANRVQGIDIVDHQVDNIEVRSLVVRL